jgi:hypothetical protein
VSRTPLGTEPEELLRRLASEAVPGSPDDTSPARRDRLVRSMKDAVERTTERKERARRLKRTAFAVAAAAGFALVAGLAYMGRAQPSRMAGLDGVSGTVVLTQEGTRQVVGSGARALGDGDSLQTAAGAQARVATAKSSVRVSESTELKLSQPSAAEERISLRRGRVEVAVDKSIEAKRSVVVETPNAEVVVRGTVFDVRVEPMGTSTSTHVHVTRGSVWVLSQGVQVALLSAGQSWSSQGGLGVDAPSPAQAAATPTPTPTAISASEPSAQPALRSAPVGKSAASRKPGTLAEENRLFAAAVEARNRGEAARAAEILGELLSTYPQTALRESAQVERFRALNRAGQAPRAASEARRYLAEHPNGFGRSEARDIALEGKE